jgi:hypothetical protein
MCNNKKQKPKKGQKQKGANEDGQTKPEGHKISATDF